MIELIMVDYALEGDCTNVGAACYGCPCYDRCDNHEHDAEEA